MRVPPPLRDTAQALGLRSWVYRKDFPLAEYCETVDGAYEIVHRHQAPDHDDGPSHNQVVPVIAAALDTEGALVDYCLEKQYEIPDDEAWAKVLRACAWVVLQRYHLDVKNGDWPPS